MGHICSPLSNRLGFNIFWNFNFHSINYLNFLNYENLFFLNLVSWFFNRMKKFGYLLSHFKLLKLNTNVSFLFFFYNLLIEENYNIFKFLFFKKKMSTLIKKIIWKFFKNKKKYFFFKAKQLKIFNNFFKKKITLKRKILKRKKKLRLNNNYIKIIFYSFFNNTTFFFNQYLTKYLLLWSIFEYKKKIFYYMFFFKMKKTYNYFFKFFHIYSGEFNSSLLAQYIITKLSQKFKLFEIINPLLKNLITLNYILGFKILCAGRFTRKQIATYFWKHHGTFSLTYFKNFLDYSFFTVILKNSLCAIKIWLNFSFDFISIFNLKKKIFFFDLN